MKLSTKLLALSLQLGGAFKANIMVNAAKCTELDISPMGNVMMNSCLNIGWESCDQDQSTCTKFSDLFGSGWRVLDDVTEGMADATDESKGRLPVFGKMVGARMMYFYFTVDGIVQGKSPHGRWVFGSTIGSGYGSDWGQAQCGATPSTCLSWGQGVNSGGKCSGPHIENAWYDRSVPCNPSTQDRSLPYERTLVYNLKQGDETRLFRSTYTSSCRSFTNGVQTNNPVEITIEPTCVSTDMSRSMSYANYETPRACVSETNDFNETIIDDPLQADDCRNTRCQGTEQNYLDLCKEPNSYWDTCQCNIPGFANGNFGIESVLDDPSLSSDGNPSPPTPITTPATTPATNPATNPATTPIPTYIPTYTPTNIPTENWENWCENDDSFVMITNNGKTKDCNWVSRKPRKRCDRVGDDGVTTANEACPLACNPACAR